MAKYLLGLLACLSIGLLSSCSYYTLPPCHWVPGHMDCHGHWVPGHLTPILLNGHYQRFGVWTPGYPI